MARLDRCGADLELIALAKSCLAPDRQRRPPDGAAVAQEMTAYLAGVQQRLRQAELSAAQTREARKRRRVVTGMLALPAVGSLVAAFYLKQERDSARQAEGRATNSEKERLQELYRAYLHESRASRLTGNVGQRENGLAALGKILATVPREQLSAEQLAEMRDEAIACLAYADLRELRRVPLGPQGLHDIDVGESFAVVFHRGQRPDDSRLTSIDGGQTLLDLPAPPRSGPHYRTPRHVAPGKRWLIEFTIHPASEMLEPRLRIFDRHAQRWTVDRACPEIQYPPAVLADGRHAILPGVDSALCEIDLLTGVETRRSPPQFGRIALAPDGKHAAIASRNEAPRIIRLADWQTVETLSDAGTAISVAWSGDGAHVVFGGGQGRLWQWDVYPKIGYPLNSGHRADVQHLCFSPDSRYLASSSLDGLCVVRRVLGDQRLFTVPGSGVRFASDSKRLAVIVGGDLTIHQLLERKALISLLGPFEAIEYSPDGALVAASGPLGVRCFEPQELHFRADLGLDWCGPVGFHPEGREFVTFGTFSNPWRWPLLPPDAHRPHWQLGAPRRAWSLWTAGFADALTLQPQHRGRHAVWSGDGKFIVAADFRNNKVLRVDAAPGAAPGTVGKLDSAYRVAVSPDSAWIAGGGLLVRQVQVWNALDQRSVFQVPGHSSVFFSHDGRWLVTSAPDRLQIHRVGDWHLERELQRAEPHEWMPIPAALQRRGPLLAYAAARGNIRLCQRDTGRVVANLVQPEPVDVSWLTFSPDDTRLAFASMSMVGVWDLAELRQGLEALGVDGSDLPPAVAAPARTAPARVERGSELPSPKQWSSNWLTMARWETLQHKSADALSAANEALAALPREATAVERAHVLTSRGQYHLLNGNREGARADWQQALTLVPLYLDAARALARLSVLGPIQEQQPERALALLAPIAQRQALDADGSALLGSAHVRLGQHDAGLKLLRATHASSLGPFVSWYLALGHHHAGDAKAAAEAAHSARLQTAATLTDLERDELRRLQAEVEALLGTEK